MCNAKTPAAANATNPQSLAALGEAYLRTGMSEQEVVALLGEPEERKDVTFVYCLGRALIDYDFYHITFDGEDGITSFRNVPS